MGALIKMGSCPFCGQGTRTPCFAIYNDGYHCYSCGKNKHGKSHEYAFRPQIQTNNLAFPRITLNPNEFSLNVLQWLYKYYVFEDLIYKYKIGYSLPYNGSEESLVYGCYDKNELLFWQQRFFPSKRFKTGGDKNTLFLIETFKSKYIVLVEDFISAIRVGEHVDTLCLWGTSLNYKMINFLKFQNRDIIIWLDPDDAGRTASKKLLEKLKTNLDNIALYRAFSIRESRTVSILETGKQPKDYCPEEIIKILENYK